MRGVLAIRNNFILPLSTQKKAFDKVQKEIFRLSLKKLGVMEWLVRMVMAMCSGIKSRSIIINVLNKRF